MAATARVIKNTDDTAHHSDDTVHPTLLNISHCVIKNTDDTVHPTLLSISHCVCSGELDNQWW